MNNIKYDIVNLSSSMLKRFNAKPFHETIPEIDKIIKDAKQVVVILLDAFGKCVIEKHLDETSFIRRHSLTTIKATYPPTTVASTNGFLSGRYPVENGWMGWSQYFPKYNLCVDVFRDQDTATRNNLPDGISPIHEFCSYKNIITLINEANKENIATLVMPYFAQVNGARTTNQFFKNLNNAIQNKENKFIYAYWDEPDRSMHVLGTDNKKIHNLILDLDKKIEKLVNANKDTVFIQIADHGMMNHIHIDLDSYPKIIECLERPGSLEKRTVSFKVKKEYLGNFKEIFKENLGCFAKFFDIYSQEEVIKMKLFGDGEYHPLAINFMGDFVACANDVFSLYQTSMMQSDEIFLTAHHAGGTIAERLINVSVYNNK